MQKTVQKSLVYPSIRFLNIDVLVHLFYHSLSLIHTHTHTHTHKEDVHITFYFSEAFESNFQTCYPIAL